MGDSERPDAINEHKSATKIKSNVTVAEPPDYSKKGSKKDKKKKDTVSAKGSKDSGLQKQKSLHESLMSLSKKKSNLSAAQIRIASFLDQFAADREADEWTWESYSGSSESLPDDKKSKVDEQQGKKKQKGKQGEVSMEDAESGKGRSVDQASIAKSTQDGGKSEKPPEAQKKKPKKGPKLSSKQLEELRIQEELEAKRLEEEERLKLIAERNAAIALAKRQAAEQLLRADQLNNSLNMFVNIRKYIVEKAVEERAAREWQQFLICDGLPDPYVSKQMNTYLSEWEESMERSTIEDAARRTNDIIKLLTVLTAFIEDPLGMDPSEVSNWKWVHRLFREYQQKCMDTACYRLLRSVEDNLELLNVRIAEYRRKEPHFSLCIWMRVKMPKSECKGWRAPRNRIELELPEMQMNVTFPKSFDGSGIAIRSLYLKYDHLSDLCATFYPPPLPDLLRLDINAITAREWHAKMFYKYEQFIAAQISEEHIDAAKESLPIVTIESEEIPTVPYAKLEVSASTHVVEEEDAYYETICESLTTRVDKHVINLRKYLIVGGVYYLDLFQQPPQPRQMASFDIFVTRLKMPLALDEVPLYIEYNPPPPMDPDEYHKPEEIEENLKKQEVALDKLVLVSVTLPQHVIWFDVPIICFWDKRRKLWTSKHVVDLKHIEEKNTITFRTASLGCFSFALNRYANLPFQTWDIKPEENKSITFQLTAAILMIEFNIKDNLICVTQLQNSPNAALQNIIGVYLKLPALMRNLREGGVDVFPDADAYCYCASACRKHWQMENHAYCTMAQLSIAFNFSWSRWNFAAGRRNIVMQMREYKPADKTKQAPYSTLYLSPLKAIFIDCTEISPMFEAEPIEGMHFYSDLITLMRGTYGMATRSKVYNSPAEQIGTFADLLLATRVLSFS